jgi:hypothetical protein
MAQHEDHRYTLREFLLMIGLSRGGEWPEVEAAVTKQLASREDWDGEARNTYMNWQQWYRTAAQSEDARAC